MEWMSNSAISMGNEVLGYNETSETSQAGGFQVKLFAFKKAMQLLTPRFSSRAWALEVTSNDKLD